MKATVLGLDLAVRNTGYSVIRTEASGKTVKGGSLVTVGLLRCVGSVPGRTKPNGRTLKYDDLPAPERIVMMGERVCEVIDRHDPDLIIIEGYAYSAPRNTHLPAMGEVNGIVKRHIVLTGRFFLTPSPSVVKKFMTGKGNAKKEDMMGAVNDWLRVDRTGSVSDNNEADAVACAMFGACLLGSRWSSKKERAKPWIDYQQEIAKNFRSKTMLEKGNYGNIKSIGQVQAKVDVKLTRGV